MPKKYLTAEQFNELFSSTAEVLATFLKMKLEDLDSDSELGFVLIAFPLETSNPDILFAGNSDIEEALGVLENFTRDMRANVNNKLTEAKGQAAFNDVESEGYTKH
jgi:hypothetical protein